MKKRIGRKFLLIPVLFLSYLFTGCDNFLTSNDIAEDIKNEIEYANAPVFSVRIAPEKLEHGVVVSGNTKDGLRVSDSFDLEFSKSADYVFLGWDAVKKDDHNISLNEYVSFANPKALNTKVTITKGNSDIYNGQLQLRPYCRAIETGIINITSTYGAVSYNSETEYKEGTLLKLSITPNPGYGFTHWVVMVGDSYDTTGEYVKIENPRNTVTDATFLKHPDNNEIIYIIPVCVDRPVIISNTPQLSDDGVCLDSRIKVVFDSQMDESSIYYSTAEIKALGPDITLLHSTDDDKKYYGYEKNGKKYYKNIEIKDRNTGINMLEYYGEPKFTSPDMLVIPTSNKDLPKYTELLVTISSNFSTKTEDGYSVSLNDKKIWNYLVNGTKDPTAPEWVTLVVDAVGGVFNNRSGTAYSQANWDWDGSWSSLTGTPVTASNIYSSTITSDTACHNYYVRDNKIKINAQFTDAGTGPSSLTLYIDKVNSSSYSNKIEKKLPIRITGNNGLFQDGSDGIVYELTNSVGNKLSDGPYRLQFVAEDESGKSAKSDYYYILLDTTNDEIAKPGSASTTLNSITFNSINGISSSTKVFYQMKKSGETDYGTPVLVTSTSQSVSSLDAGTAYNFKFFQCDQFGNKNFFTEFTKNTKPATPVNVTLSNVAASPKNVTVSWEKGTNPNYAGAKITYYRYSPETGTASSLISSVGPVTIPAGNQGNYSKEFTNLYPGYRYTFGLFSYDNGDAYNSTLSSSLATTSPTSIVLPPDSVTDFTVTDNYNGSVKLNWNKPAAGYANAYYYSYKLSSDSAAEWSTPALYYTTASSPLSKTVTLQNSMTGKSYTFKLQSAVNDSSTNSTSYAKSLTSPEYTFFIPPLNLVDFVVDSWTNSSITVKWTNPSTTYDGIKIGYRKNGESAYTYKDIDKNATSYTITGLSNSTNYDICYYTYTNNGNSVVNCQSAKVTRITRPNAVTGLTATPVSGSKIKLSWTKNFGAYTGIKLYKKASGDSGFTDLVTIVNNTDTEYTWTLTDADSGKEYEVKAVAYYSASGNTSTETDPVAANTSVDPVTNLKVTATATNSITISWTNPTTAYDSLAITYTKAGGTSTAGPSVSKTSTSATISSLDPGCSYTVYVKPSSTKNGNAYTQTTSLSQYTRPNAVTGVTVNRNSSNPGTKLDVSWAKSTSGNTTGALVFYGTGSSFASSKLATSTTDTSATITALTTGTNYYVWVMPYIGSAPTESDVKNGTALTTGSEGSYKSCYTKPNAVTGLKVTATTTGSATLSWSAPSGGKSGYRIYVKDGSGSLIYNTTVTTTSTTISSLTAGHTYTFDIRSYAAASDSNANESASTTVSQSIRPNAVSGVSVSRNSSYPTSRLTVSWSNPSTGTTSGSMVFYSTGTTFSSSTYSTYSTGTSATIQDLTPGTKYNVWVVPYAGTKPSNAATVTGGTSLNTGSEGSYKSYYTRPDAPSGLVIDTRNNTSIKISWTAPASGSVTGYNVYKKDITAGESGFTRYTYTSLTYQTINSLKIGHQYEFKVVSYASDTGGDTGNESTGITKTAYTTIPSCNFTVSRHSSAPTTKQILNWTWPATQDDLFIAIYRGTSSTFTNATYVDWWSSTSHSSRTTQDMESLTANTKYYYWIVTSIGNVAGKSATDVNKLSSDVRTISSSYSKCTAPEKPTNLSYNYDDGMGRIKITWSNPASFSSIKYNIGGGSVTAVSGTSAWVDIPSYQRSQSYTIYLNAYASDGTASDSTQMSYSNNTGNLMINGTTYQYSACNTIASSQVSVTRSTSYRWTSSNSDKFYSAFSKASGYDYNFDYDSKTSVTATEVKISAYSMGKYEVSQELFKAVVSNWNPSYYTSSVYYPVENLNIYQAMLFCNKLSTMFGYEPHYKVNIGSKNNYTAKTDWSYSLGDDSYWGFSINSASNGGFRLPNVAMWEYAARGGNTSNTTHWWSVYSGAMNTSDNKSYRQLVANCDGSSTTYVYYKPTGSSYAPNLAGLYNMSGNVWEMTDTHNPDVSNEVISMGGGYSNGTRCAVDSIGYDRRDAELKDRGFRICRNKVVQ